MGARTGASGADTARSRNHARHGAERAGRPDGRDARDKRAAGEGRSSSLQQQGDREARERLRVRLDAYMDKKGLRSTVQRRAIVDAFFEGSAHVTIEELLGEARKQDRRIGYATVYRTLKLLTESGVASERRFGDGLSRYELADEATTHHDHLICTSCGGITEFEEPGIEALQDEIAKRYAFRVTSHKHELYGTCARCSTT
jgi:Fur family ferric uptake transcriptional regulator